MIPSSNVFRYSRARWRQRMRAREPSTMEARTGMVAISIVDYSRSPSTFVDIRNLVVAVLYEERCLRSGRPNVPLRFATYNVCQVTDGLVWGGADNCQLFKDLRLTPRGHARGQRMDRCRSALLSTALRLESRLARLARYPAAPLKGLTLPRVWAGFRQRDTPTLMGDGPEFEQACEESSIEPSDLFHAASKPHFGLALYPLEWVAGRLDRAVGLFAELTPNVRNQTFRCAPMPDGLVGFQGANAFDFYSSRYRAAVIS
jgi:hypothetical protein